MFGKTRFAIYSVPVLALAAALIPADLQAASCGSIAAPTTCTVTVGSLKYTASGFSLSAAGATGLPAPVAAEITIDISNPSGTQASVTFSRLTGGAVFATNSNQSLNFTVNYTMTVAPVGAGTAGLVQASLTDFIGSSGNGSAQDSWVIGAQPPCVRTTSGTSPCMLPGAVATVASSDSISITGNTDGNASWLSTAHIYDAIFTPAAPVLTKAFAVPSILVGNTTTMTFTITNPNSATTFNTYTFTDAVPVGIALPSGSGASSVSGACGGTVSFTAATNTLTFSLTNLAPGATCTFVYTVNGAVAGAYTNTTSAVTAVASTVPLTGNTASAPLQVVAPQPPSISKAFNPATIVMSGTSVLTFTITNPNATLPITNVAFSDSLPAGLIVNQGPNATNTCGGTFTAVSNATSVSLTGGSLVASGMCTLTVTVQGTTPGTKVNTTDPVSATVAGTTLTGNQATATLIVDPSQVSFLIRYASNLSFGESVVNFTNSGASSTAGLPTGGQNGEICANVYAYSPDEQLVSCCSCNVTPNALNSLSVKADLGTNTLTPIIPSSLVIKVIATAGGAACTASSAATANSAVLQPGLEAWGTTIHALPVTAGTPATTYGVTETAFSKAAISMAELDRMAGLCAFIRANGSGYGICKSCKVGGLGGNVK